MVEVSVIIPVYNVEEYLEECLNSVINQTLNDIEIICINDGSTDNSLKILKDFAKRDNRIKVFNQKNKGAGATRNWAMKHANGKYVSFIDSDDYIREDALELWYKNISFNESDVVISKIARFDENNNIDYKRPAFDMGKIFKDVDFDNFVFSYSDVKKHVLNTSYSPTIKMYKKDFLNKFPDMLFLETKAYEDIIFHVKVMLNAEKISFVPNFLYFYRFNSNSITYTSNGFMIFEVIDEVKDFLMENNYFDEFSKEFELFKITQIIAYLLPMDSQDYFEKAQKEFFEMDISDNNLIPSVKLNNFNLVKSSDSLETYKKNLSQFENKSVNETKNKPVKNSGTKDFKDKKNSSSQISIRKTLKWLKDKF